MYEYLALFSVYILSFKMSQTRRRVADTALREDIKERRDERKHERKGANEKERGWKLWKRLWKIKKNAIIAFAFRKIHRQRSERPSFGATEE